MIITRTLFTRTLVVAAIVAALTASDRLGSTAFASSGAGDSKTPAKKPLPPETAPARRDVIDICVRNAYATLAAETARLRAVHATDAASFAREYERKKEELVGEAALKTRGCAPAREE